MILGILFLVSDEDNPPALCFFLLLYVSSSILTMTSCNKVSALNSLVKEKVI